MTFVRAVALIAAVISSLGIWHPVPAQADETVHSQDALCTANFAEWRSFSYDSEDPDPATHQIDPETDGVKILSCRVGTHFIRINFVMDTPRPSGMCAGADEGYISAWVDGVKVVNHETFVNDRDVCADETLAPRALISKVIVNTLLHVTICRKAGNGYGDESCDVRPLVLAGKTRDAVHDGPLVRTMPGLVPIMRADPVCAAIPADPGTVENPAFTQAQGTQHGVITITADIDNDGTPDTLTGDPSAFAGYDIYEWHWQSGKSGQSYSIDEAIDSSGIGFPHDMLLLTLNNVNYVLLENDDKRLYVIRSDGTARHLCDWLPRVLPEETF